MIHTDVIIDVIDIQAMNCVQPVICIRPVASAMRLIAVLCGAYTIMHAHHTKARKIRTLRATMSVSFRKRLG